jgi:hypothetical protein
MAIKTDQNIEELAARTRELNERIIAAGKQAGESYRKT